MQQKTSKAISIRNDMSNKLKHDRNVENAYACVLMYDSMLKCQMK